MQTNETTIQEDVLEPPTDEQIIIQMKETQASLFFLDEAKNECYSLQQLIKTKLDTVGEAAKNFHLENQKLKDMQGLPHDEEIDDLVRKDLNSAKLTLQTVTGAITISHMGLLGAGIEENFSAIPPTSDENSEQESADDVAEDDATASENVDTAEDEKPGDALDDVEAGDLSPNFRLVMGLDQDTGRSVLQDEQGNEVELHRHMKPNIDQRIPAELVVGDPDVSLIVELRSRLFSHYKAQDISWDLVGVSNDVLGWRRLSEFEQLVEEDKREALESAEESLSDQSDVPVEEASEDANEQSRKPRLTVAKVAGRTPPSEAIEGDYFLNFYRQGYVFNKDAWERRVDLDQRLVGLAIEHGKLPAKGETPAVNSHDTETATTE